MSKKTKFKNNHQLAAKPASAKAGSNKLYPQTVDKTITQTRQDIAKMRTARNGFTNSENPIVYLYYNLLDYTMDDPLLSSQLSNRVLDSLGSVWNLGKKGGDIDAELTESLQNSELFNDLITHIIHSQFYGHSLVELDWKQEGLNEPTLAATLIPRTNVITKKGTFLFDYNEDKGVQYRELPEFGTWLLEFGKPGEMGILNKAIPYALFERFTVSCWSELTEIYGIPPRVYKTDTQDPQAVARGKKMMTDMGSAAWFIIDSTEEFEWAQGVSTNGDVYDKFLKHCDNKKSLLISGAIVGQDTKNGSNSKEVASQKLLSKLVLADMAMVEMYMNSKVMPALARIGIVPADYVFKYDIPEDLQTLWEMVVKALQYFEVDPEWIKSKFGIQVTGVRQQSQNPLSQNLGAILGATESFFV